VCCCPVKINYPAGMTISERTKELYLQKNYPDENLRISGALS